MTGFGSAQRPWPEAPAGPSTVSVEIRSVNARFLEVKVRQPFGVATEHALRKQVEAGLGRGRVDVWVHVRAASEDGGDPLAAMGIEAARLDATLRAAEEVARRAAAAGLEVSPSSAAELLRFSTSASAASDAPLSAPEFLSTVLDEALGELLSMRGREGAALAGVLGRLADELEEQMGRLREVVASQADQIRERLQQRVDEVCRRAQTEALAPERLAQEVALLVARADVAEEQARVESHLVQFREVLAAEPEAGQGKTLDFLSQELLREITTIGGKIHDGSAIVIELKGTVGRIREQVQNVE